MSTAINARISTTEQLWRQGDAAFADGDFMRAYALYTEAHDRITDCPRLHAEAHRKLKQVTRLHRNKIEFITDSVLVWLAPFGIFELIALAMRSKVSKHELCRRSA